MTSLYKLNMKEDFKADLEQQNVSLQTMLEWKKGDEPEFCSTLRLYLAARRFLRHVQMVRLLLLPLVTSLTAQNMMLLLA